MPTRINDEPVNRKGVPRPLTGNVTGNPPMTGRPAREFDPKVFEGLCSCLCTNDEISAVLQAHVSVINGWCKRHYGESYTEAKKRFSEGGKASLRRTQLHLAKKNAAMAIWCGKQYLGQVDHDRSQQEAISAAAESIIKAADKLSEADGESKQETD